MAVFTLYTQSQVLMTLKKESFNPLPDNKILALPKFKAFAEDNFNVVKCLFFLFFFHTDKKTIWEDEETTGYQLCFCSLHVFKRLFFSGSLKILSHSHIVLFPVRNECWV